jgi:hypothetical protein
LVRIAPRGGGGTKRAGPFLDTPEPSFWPEAFVHESERGGHDVSGGSFGVSWLLLVDMSTRNLLQQCIAGPSCLS